MFCIACFCVYDKKNTQEKKKEKPNAFVPYRAGIIVMFASLFDCKMKTAR